MRRYVLIAAICSALATLVAPATPAAATQSAVTDAAGDHRIVSGAADPRADIVWVGADFIDGSITVALETAQASDPTKWHAAPETTSTWGTRFRWELDVVGRGAVNGTDFDVTLRQAGGSRVIAEVYEMLPNQDGSLRRGALRCYAEPAYSTPGVLAGAVFPAACIDNPAGFRIRATTRYDAGTGWYTFDEAPDGLKSYCCYVENSQSPPPTEGYWMLTERGTVYSFGGVRHHGGIAATAVDIEPTSTGRGYWVLMGDGSVQTKGDAPCFNCAVPFGARPGEAPVSLSATPSGNGYWIFTNQGRVIARGDAVHLGDMADFTLNGPVLDSVATPSGDGYYLVAEDGGIFTFGDAVFVGSMGDKPLNKPVMSMAPDPDGHGYWLVASDGGIFAFAADFRGSMGGIPLQKPVSGMVGGPNGYVMVAEDGGIFSFGDVAFHGSLPGRGITPESRVVAVAPWWG